MTKPAMTYSVILLLCLSGSVFTKEKLETLLIYDSPTKYSKMDMNGFGQALEELGAPYTVLDHASQKIVLQTLEAHPAVVLSELNLDDDEIEAVKNYISSGGGLIATGQSAKGLLDILGIASWSRKSTLSSNEIRFETDHPVSHGCFWDGASMRTPPMPSGEIPTITQFLYPDPSWPAFSIENNSAAILAHWCTDQDQWGTGRQEAAIAAHSFGAGKVVYSGALPGVYSDPNWQWPFVWRRFIINAIEWVSQNNYLLELGYWPSAHTASFVWSGDTETADMETAVPAILDIFDSLGLENFGTFYVVGKSGGDLGTEGAQEHTAIVQMIAAHGSEVGGHGNIHIGYSGLSIGENVRRLREMIDINNDILREYGESCRGFRAPHVDFDRNTLAACAQVGLLYESSDLDVWTESTFPFLNQVWEAPPTMPMDWTLFESNNVSNQAAIEIYKDKFDYIYAKRSMFNWLCHPWVIDGHLPVLTKVLEYALSKQDVWMTRQDRLIEWWAKRSKLRLQETSRHGDIIDAVIHNSGGEVIHNATLWLKMRQGADPSNFAAYSGETSLPLFLREHNNWPYVAAVIPEIGAGESMSIRLGPREATAPHNNSQRGIETFHLAQNFPNPFNQTTKILLDVKILEKITINIYDIAGNQAAQLVSQTLAPGQYAFDFSGCNLQSGVYLLMAKSGEYKKSIKMTLLK